MPERSDSQLPLGEQIARLRRDRGMTQEQLADRSGVSVSVIRKLEHLERDSASLSTLHRLAAALGVTTMTLFCPAPQLTALPDDDERDDLHAIRRVLQPPRPGGQPVKFADDDQAPNLGELERSILLARRMVHADNFVAAVQAVPLLIVGARAAVAADGGERAQRLLSAAYTTAGNLLIHMRKDDLAYHALGLGMEAAHAAGDLVLVASSVAGETWLLIRQGRFDEAETVALATSEAIEPSFVRSPARQVASWGWLMLGASAAAVRNNRPDVAADTMAHARAAAVRVDAAGDYRGDGTTFGTAVVDWRTTENALVLGDIETALRVARLAAPPVGPSTGYHRFQLDVAAAHLEMRQKDKALAILVDLRHRAPSWLRRQRYARVLARRLADTYKRAIPADVRELVIFVGAAEVRG